MQVHLKTLGCRLNEAELENWSRQFHAYGHQLTRDAEQAGLIVINSCAVTEEAVKKSRKLLRRAQRCNPHARLVMTGCYASLDADRLKADNAIDLLVHNTDKHQLVDIIQRELIGEDPPAKLDEDISPLLFSGRQRAFIKVQDGCRYRCTYCIVTLARGAESSRAITDIIDEVNYLYASGIREVVLTGVHLGGYGNDRQSSLDELVAEILRSTDMPRLRLGSLEPWELHDGFWQLFENPRLMPHLHLPLQSGTDSVLRRMSRRCRTDEFRDMLATARSLNPLFNITTDIIVGFPGETESEWQQGLEFIASCRFGHVHIFAFSPRTGTKAATLPDQVPLEIRRQRSEILHRLAEDMKRENLQNMLQQTAEVLFEGNQQLNADATLSWSGYSANFQRVTVNTARNDLCNRILPVHINDINADNTLSATLSV